MRALSLQFITKPTPKINEFQPLNYQRKISSMHIHFHFKDTQNTHAIPHVDFEMKIESIYHSYLTNIFHTDQKKKNEPKKKSKLQTRKHFTKHRKMCNTNTNLNELCHTMMTIRIVSEKSLETRSNLFFINKFQCTAHLFHV